MPNYQETGMVHLVFRELKERLARATQQLTDVFLQFEQSFGMHSDGIATQRLITTLELCALDRKTPSEAEVKRWKARMATLPSPRTAEILKAVARNMRLTLRED